MFCIIVLTIGRNANSEDVFVDSSYLVVILHCNAVYCFIYQVIVENFNEFLLVAEDTFECTIGKFVERLVVWGKQSVGTTWNTI